MPNYCANRLTAWCPPEERAALRALLERLDAVEDDQRILDFSVLAPCAPDDDPVRAAARQWGTKWNAIDCEREEDADRVVVHFSTAWSPPAVWFDRLADAVECRLEPWPLELCWAEQGSCRAGVMHVRDGTRTETETDDDEAAALLCWRREWFVWVTEDGDVAEFDEEPGAMYGAPGSDG